MKRFVIVLIALMLSSQAWAEDERGLVGYWNFDEGQGREARDASGKGHHGRVRGGATWVEGRQGGALEFNGTDSLVEIAEPQGLNLAGDMTFMAWVKTSSDEARDRLIFGDVAGLAIHRNITIELDRGALHVGHGNDAVYGSFSPSLVFDGGWKHLAIVFEKPSYYLYVDGGLYESGDLAVPVSRTNGAGRSIGGWGPGYFKGTIDEVRLYNRALAEREIVGHLPPAAPAADQAARISLTPRLKMGTLGFNALFTRLAAPDGARIDCELTLKGEKDARRAFSAALVATRPDSERAIAEAEVTMEKLVSGTYLLVATVRDASDKVLSSIEKEVAIVPPPEWLGSKAGVTDAVLPPYTPVEVKDDAGAVVVDVWGRTYRLGESGASPPDRHSRRCGTRRAGATASHGQRQGSIVVRGCTDDSPAGARPGDLGATSLRRRNHRAEPGQHRVRRAVANRLHPERPGARRDSVARSGNSRQEGARPISLHVADHLGRRRLLGRACPADGIQLPSDRVARRRGAGAGVDVRVGE